MLQLYKMSFNFVLDWVENKYSFTLPSVVIRISDMTYFAEKLLQYFLSMYYYS